MDLASSFFFFFFPSFSFFLFPFIYFLYTYIFSFFPFPFSFSLFSPSAFLFSPLFSHATFSLFPFPRRSGWQHPSNELMRLSAGSRICVGGSETMLSCGSARCRPRSGSGPSPASMGLPCAVRAGTGEEHIQTAQCSFCWWGWEGIAKIRQSLSLGSVWAAGCRNGGEKHRCTPQRGVGLAAPRAGWWSLGSGSSPSGSSKEVKAVGGC